MKFIEKISPEEVLDGGIRFLKSTPTKEKFSIWLAARLRDPEKFLPKGFEEEYAELLQLGKCYRKKKAKIESLFKLWASFWGIES